jgi:hypothetical protein
MLDGDPGGLSFRCMIVNVEPALTRDWGAYDACYLVSVKATPISFWRSRAGVM